MDQALSARLCRSPRALRIEQVVDRGRLSALQRRRVAAFEIRLKSASGRCGAAGAQVKRCRREIDGVVAAGSNAREWGAGLRDSRASGIGLMHPVAKGQLLADDAIGREAGDW